MSARTALFLLAALLLVAPAHARKPTQSVQLDVQRPVAVQLSQVEAMLDDKAYSELGLEGRQRVADALGAIRLTLSGRSSARELDVEERTVLLAQQDIINTEMVRAHTDSRMICKRETGTGSRFASQVCRTAAQRRMSSQTATSILREAQPSRGQMGRDAPSIADF